MEGRFHSSSNKRSHSQYEGDSGGDHHRNVRQKRRGFDHRAAGEQSRGGGAAAVAAAFEEVVYRILCPGSRIGSVIGKGGSIIKSLRHETGARIKVADGLPGVDERVILISASPKERREGRHHQEKPSGDAMEVDSLPASQEALFKVFARIVHGEGFEEEDVSRNVTTRLLVPNNQIGCLLGKAGKIIEQMRTETGAQIRVLPKEQLPKCAFDNDELVQLTGEFSIVKRALLTVSTRLYDNPPRDRPQAAAGGALNFPQDSSPILPAGALFNPGAFFPQGNAAAAAASPAQLHHHHQLLGIAQPPLAGLGVSGSTWGAYGTPMPPALHTGRSTGAKEDSLEAELTIRLLCPNDKIGSVIGKGGNIVRRIREETCARIKIEDAVPSSEERVIMISSTEVYHEQVSPSLEAVLQLQSRIADISPEKDGSTTSRFLVPSASIGCLLGKKGSIIAEMRRSTRAVIRILSKESLPKCALEDDELIQVVGDLNVAREAVIEIITRLRANIFKGQVRSGAVQASVPVASFEARPLEPPAGMFSLPGLTTQGLRSSIASSPRTWGLQGAGGLGALAYGANSTPSAVFGSRSTTGLLASVAGTTIEISIPAAIIGSIIGKGGCNIAQIRHISGAKVKLHDAKPGGDKRIIEISGSPEQTQAAQSLLEAFMFTAQTQGPGAALY